MNAKRAKKLRKIEKEKRRQERAAETQADRRFYVGLIALLLVPIMGFAALALSETRDTPRESIPALSKSPVEPSAAAEDVRSIDDEEITPATWKSLDLELHNEDGSVVEIGLSRPNWWLEAAGAKVGGSIALSIPEMGVDGDAKVLSIEPVPIDSRDAPPGASAVIGTFAHDNATVLDLYFNDDTSKPLGVTANHPLWSASRDGWIKAGELGIGEYVETTDGVAQLTARHQRPGLHKVYNLEVHKTHNYYVSELGILAHNSCADGGHLRSPKTIKFSQRSINRRFGDQRPITETAAMLRRNPEGAARIEPILLAKFKDLPASLQKRLIEQGGNEFDVFAVTGNRRLAAARLAGSKINVKFSTKDQLEIMDLERKFSTTTAGREAPSIR